MPRSRGYGDVTATYIRRSEIPSRIYAKHQYRQESEYGSTVITRHDIISQEYMITKKHKSRMYNMKYRKVLTSGKMKISRADHEEAGRKRVQTDNC